MTTTKITGEAATLGDLARFVEQARAAGARDDCPVVALTGFRGTADGRFLRSVTVETTPGDPR